MINKLFSRGDTIIEVLFAVTIFSALAVSSLSIMNRTVGTAQRSLEVSLVRQEMNSQAEALRFIHDSYISGSDATPARVWSDLTASANVITDTQLATLDSLVSDCTPPTSRAFVINPRTMSIVTNASPNYFQPAQVYSQLRYNSDNSIATNGVEGIWVQQLVGETGGTDYRDFHIRACWDAPGGNVPVTLSTIVRLYVPGS